MKFLFVRPDVCRRLPSDSTSRWTPLPWAMRFPLLGLARDLHPLANAHAERTNSLLTPCKQGAVLSRYTLTFSMRTNALLTRATCGTLLSNENKLLTHTLQRYNERTHPPELFLIFARLSRIVVPAIQSYWRFHCFS